MMKLTARYGVILSCGSAPGEFPTAAGLIVSVGAGVRILIEARLRPHVCRRDWLGCQLYLKHWRVVVRGNLLGCQGHLLLTCHLGQYESGALMNGNPGLQVRQSKRVFAVAAVRGSDQIEQCRVLLRWILAGRCRTPNPQAQKCLQTSEFPQCMASPLQNSPSYQLPGANVKTNLVIRVKAVVV